MEYNEYNEYNEHLFDPEITPSSLPLESRFIHHIQGVYILMEFLANEMRKGGYDYWQINIWRLFSSPNQTEEPDSKKFIEALNFGLRDAAGSAQAMSVTMDGIAKSQEAGFNSFSQSASVLEAAMTSAGKNISGAQLDQAIGDLESSMRSFGASEEEINNATGTVKGVQQAQANTDNALEAAKKTLEDYKDKSLKEISILLKEKSNSNLYSSRILNLAIYLIIANANDFSDLKDSEKNKFISDTFNKLNLSFNKAEKDIGIYKSSIIKLEQAKELLQEAKLKDKKGKNK